MSEKKLSQPTRDDLFRRIDGLEQDVKRLQAERLERDTAARAALSREQETRKQFDDLKLRLQAAETSNQFMRGYLARVQEDDVVREELVATGEPGGEQQLTPKRKPASFPRPDDFMMPQSDVYGMSRVGYEERRRRAKHWITY